MHPTNPNLPWVWVTMLGIALVFHSAITNCHGPHGLKEPQFINLQVCRSEVWHGLTGLKSMCQMVLILLWRLYRIKYIFLHLQVSSVPSSFGLWCPSPNCKASHSRSNPTHITPLWLLLLPLSTFKDPHDCIGLTWKIQNTFSILRS